ncbi:dTDP-4-dehydrorhamnose reductase [Sulfurimonas sp. HSL1-6]|uniref:dTDP-4-dehydrorhamnose reductase n=1 Tax=Thiomicrolovo immobilis TaxID=3131935 RepID=UPI0031F8EB11
MSKHVLVTGANGQVGSELRALSSVHNDMTWTFAERSDLDLASKAAIDAYFADRSFDIIVNCAAYTAVDKAESEPEMADAINHRAVEALAQIAKAQGASLIQLSTDYVFDGCNFRPYAENDPTDPQGVYGRTKCDGEKAIQAIAPANSAIIRTAWVYSSFGNNFVKTMLRLGRERDELGVIFDQVGSPTYARDLAQAIIEIIPKLDHPGVEILHYADEGVCSWYDFARAIFELSSVECSVNAIETKEYPTPAKRPHYSLLNKAKIKADYGIAIPYWRDSLKTCLEKLKEENV